METLPICVDFPSDTGFWFEKWKKVVQNIDKQTNTGLYAAAQFI